MINYKGIILTSMNGSNIIPDDNITNRGSRQSLGTVCTENRLAIVAHHSIKILVSQFWCYISDIFSFLLPKNTKFQEESALILYYKQ